MTGDEADEAGFTKGDEDGFAGNPYDGYNDQVPPEHEERGTGRATATATTPVRSLTGAH